MAQDEKKLEAENDEDKQESSSSSPDVSAPDSAAQNAKQTELLQLPEGFEPKPMPERAPSPTTTRLTPAWRIVFRIADQKVILSTADRIIVGRKIDDNTDDVGFDLTPYGAYHFGISRKHAVMFLEDGYLYLEDLGSTNGTRINGFQLTANQKYRLRDGDEIEFARMRTSIRFSKED